MTDFGLITSTSSGPKQGEISGDRLRNARHSSQPLASSKTLWWLRRKFRDDAISGQLPIEFRRTLSFQDNVETRGGQIQGGNANRRPGQLGNNQAFGNRAQNPQDERRTEEAYGSRSTICQTQTGHQRKLRTRMMELHTLGVEGGYTQKDVQEVARCFTGWTIEKTDTGRRQKAQANLSSAHLCMIMARRFVLGQKIPAGGGIKDGEMVIEILQAASYS